MNKVILSGRLGKDPEVRYTQSGSVITSFSLATNSRKKDANGSYVNSADWHKIVIMGKSAKSAGDLLKKGDSVLVDGTIQYQEWEDKDGNKRNTTEILCFMWEFAGSKGKSSGSTTKSEPKKEEEVVDYDSDEIPF